RAKNRRIEFIILEGKPAELETRPQAEDLYLEEKKEVEPEIKEEPKPKEEETEEKPKETKEPKKSKIHATASTTITVVEPEEPELDRPTPIPTRPINRIETEAGRPANAGAPKTEEEKEEELLPTPKLGNLQMEVKVHEDLEYIKLYVKVRNISDEPIFVSPFNFFLLSEDGKGYGIDRLTFVKEGRFPGARLSPAKETGGFIFFKPKIEPAKLIYEDYLGNSVTFDF
ncbi:DUF4352 domain-containing protein, partial [bacterium]|nr:DUF4352 domain-containing protein [bacterium]